MPSHRGPMNSAALMSNESKSLKQQLIAARREILGRLATLASAPADQCREVYLFEDDHFCGVRFVLGKASATWQSASGEIVFLVDGNVVQPPKGGTMRRAA